MFKNILLAFEVNITEYFLQQQVWCACAERNMFKHTRGCWPQTMCCGGKTLRFYRYHSLRRQTGSNAVNNTVALGYSKQLLQHIVTTLTYHIWYLAVNNSGWLWSRSLIYVRFFHFSVISSVTHGLFRQFLFLNRMKDDCTQTDCVIQQIF